MTCFWPSLYPIAKWWLCTNLAYPAVVYLEFPFSAFLFRLCGQWLKPSLSSHKQIPQLNGKRMFNFCPCSPLTDYPLVFMPPRTRQQLRATRSNTKATGLVSLSTVNLRRGKRKMRSEADGKEADRPTKIRKKNDKRSAKVCFLSLIFSDMV